MKVDMLDADGRVCVEGDIFLGYEVEAHGITTRYESVIGFGKCKVVEDDKEILEGLRLICEHCGFDNVPLDTCWRLSAVRIYRIELDSITGKRNLPGGE
jgi:nitroimidazol reductase NimA-like FMN-containing flavoprotein (pyridoxamine 5'-phosphate oxidase superfamily)